MGFPGGAVFLRLDAGKFDGLAAVVERARYSDASAIPARPAWN
jgi:hypothetical protein